MPPPPSVLQPRRTTSTAASTCGAGARLKLSGPTRRAGQWVPWFWPSCSGPALRFLTLPWTPAQVSPACQVSRGTWLRWVLSLLSPEAGCPQVDVCVSSGRAYVVCGDDRGRLWTYHIGDLQKSSSQTGKPIQPTEVCLLSFIRHHKHGDSRLSTVSSALSIPPLTKMSWSLAPTLTWTQGCVDYMFVVRINDNISHKLAPKWTTGSKMFLRSLCFRS